MSRRKHNWFPILILFAMAATACAGAFSAPVQSGIADGIKTQEISALEISTSPAAGKDDFQPISTDESPIIDPVSELPGAEEKPAADPETPAESQSMLGRSNIGGLLAADLVPIAAFQAGNGTSTSAAVTTVGFSPDSTLVAVALSDGVVQLWSSPGESLLYSLEGHTAKVTDLAFSPDGTLLATAGEDSRVMIWEVATGTRLNVISTSLIGRALAVTFSSDGNQIAVGGHKCAVAQYSIWTGLLNRTFPQPGCDLQDSGSVESWGLVYTPDGSELFIADGQTTEGGSVQVWDPSAYTGSEQVKYFNLGVQDLALSPDGAILAVALIGSSQVALVDTQTGTTLHSLGGHLHRVNGVAFSPDGRLLASASRDGTVRLWDVTSGFLLKMLTDHNEAVNTVAFSPTGSLIASASDDGVVIIWGLSEEGN